MGRALLFDDKKTASINLSVVITALFTSKSIRQWKKMIYKSSKV
jgi:hypothetical protein